MEKKNWRKLKNDKKKVIKQSIYYAGFWSRVLSFIIDIFIIGLPITFIIMIIFGYEQMQSISTMDVLQGIKHFDGEGNEIGANPLIAITHISLFSMTIILLWKFDDGKTPGKRLCKTKIVNQSTFKQPKLWQFILRFFSYFFSFITIFGFFLPLISPKKMALHDYISKTVVIYDLN